MCGSLILAAVALLSNPGAISTATQAQGPVQVEGDLSTLAGSGEAEAGVGSVQGQSELFAEDLSFEEAMARASEIRAQQEARKLALGRTRPVIPMEESEALRPAEDTPPTDAGDENVANAVNDLRFFQNHNITSTEVPTNQRSTIMEPTAISVDNAVFYTGNWFAAKSTDGGSTFSYISPYTFFPSVNGGFCCDQVTAYAPSQNMALWGLQYIDAGGTNTLRVARAIGGAGISNNSWVYWDLRPQITGFGANVWFDYPSFAVGATNLYITTNAFSTLAGTPFVGNVMIRIPLSQLAAGGTINFSYLVTSVWTLRPTDGAGTTMYIGSQTTSSVMRIYRWADASGTIFWDDVNLNAYNFLNRNGVATSPDGTNWALRADSRVTTGYLANGVIGFMWSARQGGARPKPYTVHARFSEATRALISQGDIWHTDYAWMYPSTMPNSAGHLAGTLQIGGAASGTFAYPGTQLWVADDITPLVGPTITAPIFVSAGNDGPNNNAWGDFFSVRRHSTRPRTWVAASHTLSGGGNGSNAIPKYFWVGRERDNPTPATMSSPAPGSTLPGSSATFSWSPGWANLQYWLYVGTTGVGSANIWNQDQGLSTSRLVTGLPTGGGPVYVRLWTRLPSGWTWIDYTYVASSATCVRAAMTSPLNGATLAGSSQTFNWNAGTGNTQYWLYVGTTGVGSANIWNQSQGTALSRLVTGIPTNGLPVYVRLWSLCGGTWSWFDYQYTAYTVRATLTSPAEGSVLPASASFAWSAGLGSSQYWVYIGSSLGAADIRNQNMGTSRTLSGVAMPSDGRRIYLRLWSLVSGFWYYNDYRFTAPGTSRARMTSPIEESVLPGSSATFNWAAGTSATQYWIYVGNSLGAANYANQNRGTNLNATVAGLPTDRRPIYVRLWSLVGGSWVYNDYIYRAYDGGATRGRLHTPVPNTTLVGSSTTFAWSAGSGATQYWIYIGSAPGGANYGNANKGNLLSHTAPGLPTNGSTVYVRLWSLVGGSWVWNDYEYQAAP
jgi:hypothetical protein